MQEKKIKKYYGELVLGVVVKSKLMEEKFKSMFDSDGLRGELVLKLVDGTETKSEVIGIFSTNWEKFDE